MTGVRRDDIRTVMAGPRGPNALRHYRAGAPREPKANGSARRVPVIHVFMETGKVVDHRVSRRQAARLRLAGRRGPVMTIEVLK
jgi:hypothetical protein